MGNRGKTARQPDNPRQTPRASDRGLARSMAVSTPSAATELFTQIESHRLLGPSQPTPCHITRHVARRPTPGRASIIAQTMKPQCHTRGVRSTLTACKCASRGRLLGDGWAWPERRREAGPSAKRQDGRHAMARGAVSITTSAD